MNKFSKLYINEILTTVDNWNIVPKCLENMYLCLIVS